MSWIEARLKCSPESAWTILRETLLSDIEEWRQRTGAGPDSPSVSRQDRQIIITANEEDGPWVNVQKKETHIKVRRPHHLEPGTFIEHELIPRLNQAGECRLWIGEEELEFWQASRRILEPVLFR